MNLKKIIKLAVVVGVGVWFYTSGNFQRCLDYFTVEDRSSTVSAIAAEPDNFAKDDLLNLIEDQDRLVDDIVEARQRNDRDGMKRLFAEFEELETQFQATFSEINSKLSTADANEISRQHREIMRKLN